MASTWFQNGQRVIVQVLDWLQTTASNYTGARIEDYSQSGICKLELGEFAVTPGSNNTPTTPSVSVGNGVAYDFNNQRVIVSDTNSFNASNPTNTTNDGTGNFVSTPQSTGSQNIPLTVNSQNYLWIQYLVTVNTSLYTLQDITLAKQFYEYTDGYQFIVTTTNVPPSITSIFIAGINLTGSGVVSSTTISQLGRVYTGNVPYRNYVQTVATNLSDRTVTYTSGNQKYFLDDHIKAVGSGTVGPQNPHGLSPQDIGLSGASTLQFHQEFLHSAGIVGVSSTVQAQIINITPGFDQLLVNPIPANAVVTSNGISLTSTDIPNTTTLQFTSSDAPGTWYVYVDIINKLISRTQTNLISTPNPNQYLIYTVFYTFPAPDSSNGHLSALTDKRIFGNIATRELQQHSVTGPKIDPATLGQGLGKDGSDDLQVNVDGITIHVNGSNQLAVSSSTFAGNGLNASGSVLNVNPDNSTINIISNQVQVANNGITGLQINPAVAGNGLSGGGGSNLSVNVDNSSLIISGDVVQVQNGGITTSKIAGNAVTIPQFSRLSSNVGWILNAGGSADGQILTFNLSTSASIFISAIGVISQTSGSGGYTGIGVFVDGIGFIPGLTTTTLGLSTPFSYNNIYMVNLPAGTFSVRTRIQRTGVGATGSGNFNSGSNLFAVAYFR